MEENGYVFSPLDLKILLLFLLRRLPSEIDSERLMLLCQEDGVVSYFDYTIGLEELCESGQITLEEGWCRITDRGRITAEALESSLPYSVRFHAEQTAAAEAEQMQRDNSITASHGSEDTGCHVELRLNDGISDILSQRSASFMKCVVINTVTRSRRDSSMINSQKLSRATGSTPLVGSSRIRRAGR